MVKNRFVPTGNKGADIVTACISHYEHYHRRCKTIYLSKNLWFKFIDYVQQADPEYVIDGQVEFDCGSYNVMIKRLSPLSLKDIDVELVKIEIPEA